MKARADITEVHFLPFNPVEKRTAITYYDNKGDWYRSSKGAPEQVSIDCMFYLKTSPYIANSNFLSMCQIIDLCQLKGEMKKKAHEIIDNFAERGLRSLGVARQVD